LTGLLACGPLPQHSNVAYAQTLLGTLDLMLEYRRPRVARYRKRRPCVPRMKSSDPWAIFGNPVGGLVP